MKATDLTGKTVRFHPDCDPRSKPLVGMITEAKDNGRTKRGDIPDFELVVRGSSGKTLTVSFVDSYASIFQP